MSPKASKVKKLSKICNLNKIFDSVSYPLSLKHFMSLTEENLNLFPNTEMETFHGLVIEIESVSKLREV